MTGIRLSLVVPVYNVAPYLPRCLESLAALDPPADEIIAVDDGSTDRCPEILAEWAQRLPQMRVIRQENGGLSEARNTGLDAARGTFLAFVDSDDFVEPDAYSYAIQAAERDALDMVLFNARYHFEERREDYPIYGDISESGVLEGKEWLRQRLRAGRLMHMVWMHLYRREFIERHHFRFVPRLIHEDVIWTTRALLAAKRVCWVPKISLNYRIPIRNLGDEAMQRRLATVVDSSVVNARAEAEMAAGVEEDAELNALMRFRLVDGALSVFHLLAKMPDRTCARRRLVQLRNEGFIAFLWQHAQTVTQHRRIARHWLRSWLGTINGWLLVQ